MYENMGKGLLNMLKVATAAIGLITVLHGIGKMANGEGGRELTPYMATGAIATASLYAASRSYEKQLDREGR